MLRDNLNKMLDILSEISKSNEYKENSKLINDTLVRVNSILVNEANITVEDLDLLNENIKLLDRTYEDLFELVNLYDPVYYNLKRNIHKYHVEQIRNIIKQKF